MNDYDYALFLPFLLLKKRLRLRAGLKSASLGENMVLVDLCTCYDLTESDVSTVQVRGKSREVCLRCERPLGTRFPIEDKRAEALKRNKKLILPGPNDLCICESGKKFKKCCGL